MLLPYAGQLVAERDRRGQPGDTSKRRFADSERGYENVAVLDVARAAEVAEQTVYNYFPTKEHLVLDLEEPLRDRLIELIRARAAGVSPAAAMPRPDRRRTQPLRHCDDRSSRQPTIDVTRPRAGDVRGRIRPWFTWPTGPACQLPGRARRVILDPAAPLERLERFLHGEQLGG